MKTIVRFEKVTKNYGDIVVLKELDLNVEEKEKIALIGPSGSGKSTILRLLMTLEKPSDGLIYINNEPLNYMWKNNRLVPADERHLRRMRGNIGMVFQQFNLFPHMNVIENIIEGPIHVLGLTRKEAVERAEGLLEMLALSEKRVQLPTRLSGGEQQRVAIARALAMQPKVMLFDEVTSALDPELVGEVLNSMRKIAYHYNITMIIVTHEMGFAKEFADRVCFLEGGKIIEQGFAMDLLNNPKDERTIKFLQAVLK